LYGRCSGATAVAHLRIVGGGHQLPGGLPFDPGQAASIDIPWEVWRFFRAHGVRHSS
jgi:poly(3-hydroxybutyrate) depolymerase